MYGGRSGHLPLIWFSSINAAQRFITTKELLREYGNPFVSAPVIRSQRVRCPFETQSVRPFVYRPFSQIAHAVQDSRIVESVMRRLVFPDGFTFGHTHIDGGEGARVFVSFLSGASVPEIFLPEVFSPPGALVVTNGDRTTPMTVLTDCHCFRTCLLLSAMLPLNFYCAFTKTYAKRFD